jgi:SAM-dependent methyltransferase
MPAQPSLQDTWAAGDIYETFMGRWSRPVAREFIAWLALPAQLRWLDVGCGTGALTQTILERAAPAEVTGVEPSEGFIAVARKNTGDPRARFLPGAAGQLPVDDASVDAAVAGLVLNFVPAPAAGIADMRRVLRPGGTVAVYVWDYAGEMQLLRHFWNAAAAVDPGASKLDEGMRFPICKPEPLLALLTDAGFERTEYKPLDVPTMFKSFDDYWSPFLGGQGPAPTYCAALPDDTRARLREEVRARLPIAADGSIPLMARAHAVRGVRPR